MEPIKLTIITMVKNLRALCQLVVLQCVQWYVVMDVNASTKCYG